MGVRSRPALSLVVVTLLGLLAMSACRTSTKPQLVPPPRAGVSAKPALPSGAPPIVLALPTAPIPVAASPAGSVGDKQPQDVRQRKYLIAALGDSLTDFRTAGGGYLRYIEQHCPQSKIDNFGKGGDMVNQMRRRFEAEILTAPAGTYSDLILFGGVNDLYSDETALRSNEKITSDLAMMYRQARAAGMRIVALTVAPWGGFKRYFTPHRSENTRKLNAWILAQKGQLVEETVDTYPLLSCGDSERFCDAYEFSRPDGLHFNRAGHEKLGLAVWQTAFADCL